MLENSQKCVILDFDGVIADTVDICFEINKRFNPGLTRPEYLRRFDANINLHAASNVIDSVPPRAFIGAYDRAIDTARSFPGMAQAVATLATAYKVAIVSSSHTKSIRKFLANEALDGSVDLVLGNDVAVSKVTKFQMLLRSYRIDRHDCVFITDTIGDLREARSIGIDTIAVSWGYQEMKSLLSENPWSLATSPWCLLQLVSNYFAQYVSRSDCA